jgi:hypothetical protein
MNNTSYNNKLKGAIEPAVTAVDKAQYVKNIKAATVFAVVGGNDVESFKSLGLNDKDRVAGEALVSVSVDQFTRTLQSELERNVAATDYLSNEYNKKSLEVSLSIDFKDIPSTFTHSNSLHTL